ncbi:MAG: 3-phosphoshikimate 1-carboxyvinyltransferase [Crocinitomicaceae bacterium]
MIVSVPTNFKVTEIHAPASKSYAQRALFAACLADTPCLLSNLGNSDDVLHIKAIIEQLGAELKPIGNQLSVQPKANDIQRVLDCGESGLGIRLTTSIAASFGGTFEIHGKGSLTQRPMQDFEQFLPQLGVHFSSSQGLVPLKISGQLLGGEVQMDGSLSSQFLSGLLMALPLSQDNSIIHVNALKSTPYIDMTIDLLKDFGIEIRHEHYETFTIKGGQKYKAPVNYSVEGDWSGAAFWIVYGAIANPILIKGLNQKSSQADRAIMEVLKQTGARFSWKNGDLAIQPSVLNPFNFDATHCPDLFPILATLAAAIEGTSIIKGVGRLKFKESDRATAIQQEFFKLGLEIEIQEDTMLIKGTGLLKGGLVSSRNDHRMAMSLAIASSISESEITITEAKSVNKSYPEFWEICPNKKQLSE